MNDAQPPKTVWPTLNYADARAAIGFLVDVLGFEERTVHTSAEDETFVEHAEMRWPEGGGVMLGTADPDGNPFKRLPTGVGSTYVVTDDPDVVLARVEARVPRWSGRCATRTTAPVASPLAIPKATSGASVPIEAPEPGACSATGFVSPRSPRRRGRHRRCGRGP